MALTDEAGLRQALRALVDPASGRDIVAAGLVDSLTLRGNLVHLALKADRKSAPAMETVRARAEALLRAQPGITNVTAVLTAHRDAAPEPPPPAAALLPDVRFHDRGGQRQGRGG